VRITNHAAPHHADFTTLFDPNILLSTLFSNTLILCSSLKVRDQVSHPYTTAGKIIVLYILTFTFFDSRRGQKVPLLITKMHADRRALLDNGGRPILPYDWTKWFYPEYGNKQFTTTKSIK
jgi:hypothetical protein